MAQNEIQKYKTYEESGKQMIERLVPPHFKAEIKFSDNSLYEMEITEWISPSVDLIKTAEFSGEVQEFLRKETIR